VLVAAGVAVLPQHGTAPPDRDRVLLAAHHTQETTYRFTVTSTFPDAFHLPPTSVSGVFDPVHHRGRWHLSGAVVIRVDHNCWIQLVNTAWQPYPCAKFDMDTVSRAFSDPDGLLDFLRTIASVRYAGRAGTVDTYAIEFTGRPDVLSIPAGGSRGTVEVDTTTNRLIRVHYGSSTVAWYDITFYDFGVPVNVTPPK